MKHKENLLILRSRIPVGIREGLDLLKSTKGNVIKAEKIFKTQYIKAVVEKTGCTAAQAEAALIQQRFDLSAALIVIEDAALTETEKILKRIREKAVAINRISSLVLEHEKLKRTYWLEEEVFQALSGVRYIAVLIAEWLDYEDCESFENAVLFYPEKVVPAMEQELDFPGMADVISELKNVQDFVTAFCEKYKIRVATRHRILTEHKAYERLTDFYKEHKPVLVDKLYDFIVRNIEAFP